MTLIALDVISNFRNAQMPLLSKSGFMECLLLLTYKQYFKQRLCRFTIYSMSYFTCLSAVIY